MNSIRLFATQGLVLAATALSLLVWPEIVCGQCPEATLENMSTSTNLAKCGIPELCNPSTPAKMYLKETIVQTGHYNRTEPGDAGNQLISDSSFNSTTTTTVDPLSCSSSNNCSGSATAYDSDECDPDGPGSTSSATLSSDCIWSDYYSSDAPGIAGTIINSDDPDYWLDPSITSTCASTSSTDELSDSGDDVVYEGVDSWDYDIKTTTTLTSEYTDEKLRGNIISIMPPYPAVWSDGSGSAFWSLNANATPASGSAGKMKYRIAVTDCQSHDRYKVKWQQITTYPSGQTSEEDMQEEVSGTGDPTTPVYTKVREVDVPSQVCTITEVIVGPPEEEDDDQ